MPGSTDLWVQGKLCHKRSQRRNARLVIQRSEVIQQLQGPHQRFRCRRIDVIKLDEVLDVTTPTRITKPTQWVYIGATHLDSQLCEF